jgi:hypothetical protein
MYELLIPDNTLKGQCHEIFDPRFFHQNILLLKTFIYILHFIYIPVHMAQSKQDRNYITLIACSIPAPSATELASTARVASAASTASATDLGSWLRG